MRRAWPRTTVVSAERKQSLTSGKCKMVRQFTPNMYGRPAWYCEACQKGYDMVIQWN